MEISFEQPDGCPRKWSLLLAENGVGKTTLLRAIALVTAGSDALGSLLTDIDSWVRHGHDEAHIEAVIATANHQTRDVSLTIRRGDTLATLLERNKASIALLEAALRHADRNYFVVGYGASRRLASGGFSSATASFGERSTSKLARAEAVATLFSNDAPLYPLDTWIMQLDYQQGDLDVVRDALARLMPRVTFKRIDRRKGQVLFDTPDGEVPLERLSDGYQNVAAWCGDLLRRVTDAFPDRARPLDARGLLLIDEIDLHLHPQWQRQLIDFVDEKLPNFQVVATTHSPITAQQVGPGELLVLRRPEPGVPPELKVFDGDPRKLRIEQLIVSPLFGLDTGLSLELEQARARHLEARNDAPPALQATMELAPTINDSPLERRRVELLEEIRAAVASGTQGATATKRKAGKGKRS